MNWVILAVGIAISIGSGITGFIFSKSYKDDDWKPYVVSWFFIIATVAYFFFSSHVSIPAVILLIIVNGFVSWILGAVTAAIIAVILDPY